MSRRHTPVRRVAIFGYFGAGNLGDEAVVDVVIDAVRGRWPDAAIEAICLSPDAVLRDHGIPGFPIRRMGKERSAATSELPLWRKILRRLSRIAPSEVRFLFRALAWLRGTDLVLVGGSGQLIDDEGGPWNHPYNHLKWVVMARIVGARFAFLSVGAGPIHTKEGRWFIRHALQWARYVSFRDEFSRELARSIGVTRPMELYPDQAFGIRKNGHAHRVVRGVIGVAPMAYCDPRHWSVHDSQAYARYLDELSAVVAGLIRKRKKIILFHTQVDGDDRSIPDLLDRTTLHLTREEAAMISTARVASPDDALAAIAQTEMVIASRFHAVLFALNLKRPVVAISYHQKVDDLMEGFGQGEYVTSIDAFIAGRVLQLAEEAGASRTELIRRIESRIDRERELLREQYDRVLIGGAE